jgi:formiminoglutamase
MEVIKFFAGCAYQQQGTITNEEILEVMMVAGRNPRVRVLDITEFNPSFEDYNSSLLILNMVYYYLLGRANR